VELCLASAYNGGFENVDCHYDSIMERLNLLTLDIRGRHFDVVFLSNVFSVIETVGLGFLLGT
jgi:hypothetical protein